MSSLISRAIEDIKNSNVSLDTELVVEEKDAGEDKERLNLFRIIEKYRKSLQNSIIKHTHLQNVHKDFDKKDLLKSEEKEGSPVYEEIKKIDRESPFSIENEDHSVPSKVFEQNLLSEVNTKKYAELENFSKEFYGENLLKLKKEVGNSLDEELRKIVQRLNYEEKKSKKTSHKCNVMTSEIKKSQFILKI